MDRNKARPLPRVIIGVYRGLCLIVIGLIMFIAIALVHLVISGFVPTLHKDRARVFLRQIIMVLQRLVVYLCGIKIHYCGEQKPLHKLTGRFLIVANHVSYLDIVVISSLLPVAFIAKKEMGSWPLLGLMARAAQAIFVQRESVPDRVRALRTLCQRIKGTSYCVFPEGSTTDQRLPASRSWYDGSFLAARQSCQSLVCLGITYSDHEEIAWIDDMTLLGHLIKTLCRPRTDVFLDFSVHDIQEIGARSVREMAQSARAIVTSHCLELTIYEEKFASIRRPLQAPDYVQMDMDGLLTKNIVM